MLQEINEGHTNARGEESKFEGNFLRISQGINSLLDTYGECMSDATEAIRSLAQKDLKKLVGAAQRGANAKDLIKLGQALADLGRMDDALAAYAQATELDPKDDEAIARKGTALESMKHFEEAVELFQHALELNPKSMIAKRGINYADYYFTHPDSDYYKN